MAWEKVQVPEEDAIVMFACPLVAKVPVKLTVGVPVADETAIAFPAVKVFTPRLVRVRVPVADDTPRYVSPVMVCTPMLFNVLPDNWRYEPAAREVEATGIGQVIVFWMPVVEAYGIGKEIWVVEP